MNVRKSLRMENLETRTLLAADLMSGLLPPPPDRSPTDPMVDVASIDGTGNNLLNPEWGSTDEALLRITTVEYDDGISLPAGEDRPSAREVSNAVSDQPELVANERQLTDLLWLWGQFIDHDITLTENADPLEAMPVDVPAGDVYFDPTGTGDVDISFFRSTYLHDTGYSTDNPRLQYNQITAFLDGSVIYGSDAERAEALRAFEGGRLIVSEGDLLPMNEAGLDNAGGTSSSLFLAGDIRANENVALTAMQTLWVREHNRIADQLADEHPEWNDERIFQHARQIVTAELQAITYNEFLPALLGPDALGPYLGYDPGVNADISNIFSTAAYRFGHSMLSTELLRLNNDGSVIDDGNISLSAAFFAPQEIVAHGIDSLLLGAASQTAQEIDTQVVDDVRNFLFGPPGAGGFDLASLNIQRGRDHGLADYNQARIDLGLEPVADFADITSDVALQQKLAEVYGDVNNVDVWVGGLAEDHVPGSSVGELIQTVLVDQFQRIRAGDRFWYQNVFAGPQLQEIENTSLADVIRLNTGIANLQDNVFFAADAQPAPLPPRPLPPLNGPLPPPPDAPGPTAEQRPRGSRDDRLATRREARPPAPADLAPPLPTADTPPAAEPEREDRTDRPTGEQDLRARDAAFGSDLLGPIL
jgi:peroxidase